MKQKTVLTLQVPSQQPTLTDNSPSGFSLPLPGASGFLKESIPQHPALKREHMAGVLLFLTLRST